MRRIDSSSIATQCSAMYARWSASLNVPDSVWIRLHTDAHSTTGSRCSSTSRASGYTAVSASSVERVVRALERPAAADAAALQHLEREPVVLVRRALVDLEQPLAVRRARWRSPPTTGS